MKISIVVLALMLLMACKDGQIDKAKAEEKLDSAGEKIERGIDRAGDSIEAKVDRLEDRIEKRKEDTSEH